MMSRDVAPGERGSIMTDAGAGMTISVVIPSYRRRDRLSKALDCLESQTLAPTEVFVIDASPDGEQLPEERTALLAPWLRYLRVKAEGNISRQRNQALRLCSGDVVLFLDDDVEFGPDLIARYLDAFAETRADGISGVVLLPGEVPVKGPIRRTDKALYNPGGPNLQAFDGMAETRVICTASFAARRKAVLDVGGFDEQIHGNLDDVDLGIRMAARGYRIVHHNGPRVLHWVERATGSRSRELGDSWRLANYFYFQFRHAWRASRVALLLLTYWEFCRPSRDWMAPRQIMTRGRAITRSYRIALRRDAEGPRVIEAT